MTNTNKRFPLFFGSTVVLGCFFGMMGSGGAMLFTSLGVLINPLALEFGWGRDEISYAATLTTFGIIIGLLTSGFLIDRFGARRVLIVSVVLSIVVVATGPLYVSTLPLFYTMLIVAAIVGGPTNTSGYARVIASWFDRRRGLFIGINADYRAKEARKYVEEKGVSWPQLFSEAWGEKNPFLATLGISAIPSYWLIGTDGTVLGRDLTVDALGEAVRHAVSNTSSDAKGL